MPGIFNDEWGESGQIRSNPGGTRPILPLNSVANRLKWPALRRNLRLANGKMGRASNVIVIPNRP